MHCRAVVLDVARLAFAAIAIVAMTYQFASTADSGFQKANFSFFTIQSNVLGVAALCLLVMVRRAERTALFDGVRSGVVLYMAITGIVFAILLSGLQERSTGTRTRSWTSASSATTVSSGALRCSSSGSPWLRSRYS